MTTNATNTLLPLPSTFRPLQQVLPGRSELEPVWLITADRVRVPLAEGQPGMATAHARLPAERRPAGASQNGQVPDLPPV